MSCLYVTEVGATINFVGQRIEVKTKHDSRSVPIELLESIEIYGKAQMTSHAMCECMRRNIPVSFHKSSGYYLGRLNPPGGTNVARQRMQFRLTEDDSFSLNLAKRFISAKIHNQIVLLRRYSKNNNYKANDEIATMLKVEHRLERCTSSEELIGCEGYAARTYFQGMGRLVDEAFSFQGRSRRPPEDEFNAMISYGYSMLFHEIYAKVEKRGLNSYLAFLHKDKESHPALVSDLMEEWRPVIVDSTVMSLLNGHEITKEHFDIPEDKNGIFLNKEGRKIFISKMEKKFRSEMRYLAYVDYEVSFRRGLDLQVNQLIKAMEEQDPDTYMPVRIR